MKRIFSQCLILLVLFFATNASATTQSLDFSQLTPGTPITSAGIAIGNVTITGSGGVQVSNEAVSSDPVIAMWAGTGYFTFNPAISVTSITATIGSSSVVGTLVAEGSAGNTDFSFIGDSWHTKRTETLSGIGTISRVSFNSGEGWISDLSFEYTAVPVPGSILLMAAGLAGLAGIRRKK